MAEPTFGPVWTFADEVQPERRQQLETAKSAPPLPLVDDRTLLAYGLPVGSTPLWQMPLVVDNPVVDGVDDALRRELLCGVYHCTLIGQTTATFLAVAVDQIFYDPGRNRQEMRLWLAPLGGWALLSDALPTTDVVREAGGFRLAWVAHLEHDKVQLRRALPTAKRASDEQMEVVWTLIKSKS